MKRLRLDPEAYEQGVCFSLTLATADRQEFLLDNDTMVLCLLELREAAARYSASVYAYCFMPDHLHLLAAVPEGHSLVNFVRHFKQLTAHRFRRLQGHRGEALWQRRFYDHALRREEDINAAATYIWANPVRAGLVTDPVRYVYSGSLVWDQLRLSGSEDPDLHCPIPSSRQQNVGEGLQTLAGSR